MSHSTAVPCRREPAGLARSASDEGGWSRSTTPVASEPPVFVTVSRYDPVPRVEYQGRV